MTPDPGSRPRARPVICHLMCDRSPQDIWDDIGGLREVADALGVKFRCVKQWTERRAVTHCPKPVRKLAALNLYSISEWRAWYTLWTMVRRSPDTPNPDRTSDPT